MTRALGGITDKGGTDMPVNYSKYSNKTEEKVEAAVEIEKDAEAMVDEPIAEENAATKTLTGTVFGCNKLNVRDQPSLDGAIVCEVACGGTVIIDETVSTEAWYKVCAENGAEGFCMKKFIKTEEVESL